MAENGKIDNKNVLDLQAEVCPYTLVKSRMAVEKLAHGQELVIRLGNGESASNVPRTLDLEGYNVLGVEKTAPSLWEVKIRGG